MEQRYQRLMRKVRAYLLRENRRPSYMGRILRGIGVGKLFNEHYWRWERRGIAIGAGWGGAAAVSPLPFQTLWAIFACLWKKGNIPVGILMAWLSPPFFMAVFTPVQWYVGNYVLNFFGIEGSHASIGMIEEAVKQHSLAPLSGINLWMGGLEYVLGVVLTCSAIGVACYLFVQLCWQIFGRKERVDKARRTVARWVRGLLPAFVMLFMTLFVGCLVWVSTIGLPGKVKDMVEWELARQGVYVEMDNLRVSLFAGVVLEAKDVVLHNKLVEHQEPSTIGKLRLDIDMGSLWEGVFKVERAEITDGRMTLPMSGIQNGKPGSLKLENFNAIVSMDEEGVYDIVEASGELQGMRVRIEGRLSADSSSDTSFTEEELNRLVEQIESVSEYLNRISWPEHSPPSWNVRITEGENLSRSKYVVDLEVPWLEYNGVKVRDLILESQFSGNALWIKRFSCREDGARGKLSFMARVDFNEHIVAVGLRSDVPLLQWAEAIADQKFIPDSIMIRSTPSITANTMFRFDDEWKLHGVNVRGNVSIGRFDIGEIEFDRLSSGFSYVDGKLYVTDFDLLQRGRKLNGQAMLVDDNLSLEVRNTLPMETISSVLFSLTQESLDLPEGFSIRGNPDFYLKGSLSLADGFEKMPDIHDAKLLLRLDDFSALDIDLDSIVLNAEMHGKRVMVHECRIKKDDRQFAFKGQNKGSEIYFTCTSDLPPSILDSIIDDYFELPGQLKLPENIEFRAQGTVDLADDAERVLKSLQISMKADAWKWKDIEFSGLELDGLIERNSLEITNFHLTRGNNKFDLFAYGELDGEIMVMGQTTIRLDTFEKLLDLEDDDFFFERFRYTDESKFDISYLATLDLSNPEETYVVDALMKAGRAYYKGVLINAAEAEVHVASNIVTMNSPVLDIDNRPYISKRNIRSGVATSRLIAGKVVLDFNKDTVLVENLKTTAFPDYTLQMFSDNAADALAEFYYYAPVTITGGGLFPMGDDFSMMKGNFRFSNSTSQVDYDLLDTTLKMKGVSGNVSITPVWVHITNLKGNIWGGIFKDSKIDIQIDKGDKINGMIAAKGLDLSLIAQSYNTKLNKAQVEASISFRSDNGNMSTMSADGRVAFTQGNLVEIPIFGRLIGKLGNFVPGFNRVFNHFTMYTLNEAGFDYYIRNGYIRTDLFNAKGPNLILKGDGSINLKTLNVNASMRVTFAGATSFLNLVTQGFLKVHGKGPLKDVDWSL